MYYANCFFFWSSEFLSLLSCKNCFFFWTLQPIQVSICFCLRCSPRLLLLITVLLLALLLEKMLLCSRSGCFHLYCSSVGRGFNSAETNCRIADNWSTLWVINSNCFSIYFQQHSSYVCSDIHFNECANNHCAHD